MDPGDIERLIKESLPDAVVSIQDLAGDGDHYAAHVVSESLQRARPGSSNTRWSTRRCRGGWAESFTRSRCRPRFPTTPDILIATGA